MFFVENFPLNFYYSFKNNLGFRLLVFFNGSIKISIFCQRFVLYAYGDKKGKTNLN